MDIKGVGQQPLQMPQTYSPNANRISRNPADHLNSQELKFFSDMGNSEPGYNAQSQQVTAAAKGQKLNTVI